MTRQQWQVLQRLNGALVDASECNLFSILQDADSVNWQAVHQFIDAVADTAHWQPPLNDQLTLS